MCKEMLELWPLYNEELHFYDFILYFALVLPGYPDLIERYAKFLVRHFSDSRIVITGNIKLLISTRKCLNPLYTGNP